MNEARRRLLEGSQPLYLGLVGMVLAISLELLVSRVQEILRGGLGGLEMGMLGLEVVCLFQALLYLWVAWGMGTALLRVVPGYLDALGPLAVGVFAFVAVSWIDPARPLPLLALTGGAFASVLYPTARLFARAEAEPSNRAALEGIDRRRVQRWNLSVAVASLALAAGGRLLDAEAAAGALGLLLANALIAGATLEWLSQARRAAGAT